MDCTPSKAANLKLRTKNSTNEGTSSVASTTSTATEEDSNDLSFATVSDKVVEPGLMKRIKKLRDEFKSDMHKTCSSVVFEPNLERPTEAHKAQRHIVLSYNWEVQGVMLQLRDFLKQNGYSVWMDVDGMHGPIFDSLEHAVENTALVIVAMTESYQKSNSCRTEAEYAYKREVPILPLLMQRNYVADGWLGAMVENKMHVDFSMGDVKGNFEKVMQQIAKLIDPTARDVPVVSPEIVILRTKNSTNEETSSVASTTSRAAEEESIDLSLETLSDMVVTAMNDLNNTTDFSKENSFIMLEGILHVNYLVMQKERQDDLDKMCHLLISNGLLELFIRMWDACHENTEEFYTQTDSVKFTNLYTIKAIIQNYADDCVELAKVCYQNGDVIERLMREFAIPQFDVPSLEQELLRAMMIANLGILHNLVRNDTRNRSHIRKHNGIEKILAYEKSASLIIKTYVFIVLAYCINEDENEKIMTGSGVIQFIIQELLSSALESPYHVSNISDQTFSAEETVMALNKLASNDDNKKTMVETGVLPLLTMLLDQETSSDSELSEAVNCIWSLAFHPDNREKIIEEPGLIKGVKQLRDEFKSDIRMNKACSSVMFVLNLEQPTEEVHEQQKVDEGHIMLSYNWEVQDTMLQLRDFLKQNGYSIWMDVNNMHDSILAAMADAVENAALVIVAMTESYKNSNACRTEAEYAYKRKVPILPLLMQRNYDADGWLGAMVGTKLYVDLSSGDVGGKFEEARQQVAKLINSTTKTEKKIVPVVSSGNHDVVPRNRETVVDGRGNHDIVPRNRETVVDGRGNHDVVPGNRETVVDGRESAVAEERASAEHREKMEIYALEKKLLRRKLELAEAGIAEKEN